MMVFRATALASAGCVRHHDRGVPGLLGPRGHALKELAWEHLRYEQTEIKALIGTGAKAITMAQVAIEKAAPLRGGRRGRDDRAAGAFSPPS